FHPIPRCRKVASRRDLSPGSRCGIIFPGVVERWSAKSSKEDQLVSVIIENHPIALTGSGGHGCDNLRPLVLGEVKRPQVPLRTWSESARTASVQQHLVALRQINRMMKTAAQRARTAGRYVAP